MINPQMLMQMLPLLQGNPSGIAAQNGMNVPNNITNPKDMVEHLMNSGQIDQNTFNNALATARQMGYNI